MQGSEHYCTVIIEHFYPAIDNGSNMHISMENIREVDHR